MGCNPPPNTVPSSRYSRLLNPKVYSKTPSKDSTNPQLITSAKPTGFGLMISGLMPYTRMYTIIQPILANV